MIRRDYFSMFGDHNWPLEILGSLSLEFKPKLGNCQERLPQNTTFKLTLMVNLTQASRDNSGHGNGRQNPIAETATSLPTAQDHWGIFLESYMWILHLVCTWEINCMKNLPI